MTRRQKLIKLLGTILIIVLHNYIMRVKGIDSFQFISFFTLHFLWCESWSVYTERKREGVVDQFQVFIFVIYLLVAMSHYKIKLEDKAAFINRLDKQDINVNSYDITDNEYEGYFEIDIEDEDANDIINGINKQMNDENADGEGEKTTDKDELNDTKLEKNDNSKNSKTK